MGKNIAEYQVVFSKNLLNYSAIYGKTEREMAEIVGISAGTFCDWIKCRAYPRMDKIQKLADYFGVKKSDLIEDARILAEEKESLSLTKLKLISHAVHCTDDEAEKLLKVTELFLDKNDDIERR